MTKHFICCFLFLHSIISLHAQGKKAAESLHHPEMVSAFYTLIDQQNFWYHDSSSILLRKKILNVIDSAALWALDANNYHDKELHQLVEKSFTGKDSVAAKHSEFVFTDAAISFFKDLYDGSSNNLGYDELTSKYVKADERIILNKLIAICNGNCLEDVISSLEPSNNEYTIVKKEYQKQLAQPAPGNINQLKRALTYLRWINHFKCARYIVVNIPAATLRLYQADTIASTMKVVVGKASTQTPRFAAYCDKVILYPYWNVPASIATKEFLPLFKLSPGLINALNMQVIDNNGRIINPSKINWRSYNKNNFPYRLRQSTGCDNALGVMKFNLTDPFNVYMHDTNNKLAFLSKQRFLSHGCIRVEKPLELANLILPGPVDSSFVQACLKDEKPMELNLTNAIPVFVIYSTIDFDSNRNMIYYKDVYRLLKN